MPLSEPTPDWSQQVEEIHCPLCDYNLRGLTEPRCPECGHQFIWSTLLDPTQRRHPYLFEHHPNHNVWSYTQTLLGAMTPKRFWASLLPVQPSNLRRLLLYWLIGVLPAAALLITLFIGHGTEEFVQNRQDRTNWTNWTLANPELKRSVIANYGSLQAHLNAASPLPPQWSFFEQVLRSTRSDQRIAMLAALCVWPWVAMLTLMIFRISMHRARIGIVHVLRCTIYSADAGPILAGAGLWVLLLIADQVFPFANVVLFYVWWWVVLVVVWGSITMRLIHAYRLYLRFPHAVGVVLSVQFIFLLLLIQVVVLRGGLDAVERLLLPM